MASSELERFIAAIIEQESGGDYSAVGPKTRYGRAYGRYQVLETNIPAWGREAGIPNLTVATFLANPAIQDKVARAKLTSYFNRYGAAGAASAWYSGSPDNVSSTKKQGGGPSVKGYVDSVLSRMGGDTPAGTPDTPKVSRQDAIASYGYVAQLAEDVPDIRRLLDRALAEGWSPDRFTAEVQQTTWWKTTAESKRQVTTLKASDPAEYAKQLRSKRTAITILARQMGASLDSKQLDAVSLRALEQGWDTSQMQRYVAAEVKVTGGTAKGQAGVTVAELKQRAAQFFVPLSDSVLQRWTEQVLAGDVDIDAFDGYLREQAKSMFPQLAASLDSGVTAREWFAPYQQAAAEVLELPPEAVDFSQSTFRNAVFTTDRRTGASQPKNLSDYRTWLRRQPGYATTAQAREQAASMANTITEMFGKVAF